MKTWRCICGNRLHFGNTRCLKCGRSLGFAPERRAVIALEPAGEGVWQAAAEGDDSRFRRCSHHETIGCDWLVAEAEGAIQCRSCRLTATIPDQGVAENQDYWARLERAKRYLVYDALRLKLPIEDWRSDPRRGLGFDFLADQQTSTGTWSAITGHHSGRITINVAEADDVHRERMRVSLGEAYRTLLGHLRHESGHYYWLRLIADGPYLDRFRERFGDERLDYTSAMEAYYRDAPPADWSARHISAYAASHPWEDWAESWAHYLHITDAMETARDFGLIESRSDANLTDLLDHWDELSLALNALSRSLGLPDPYPFVVNSVVTEKLRLIHELLAALASQSNGGSSLNSRLTPSFQDSRI